MFRNALRGAVGVIALATLVVLAWLALRPTEAPQVRSSVSGLAVSDDTSGFARADAPRAFAFPADHGAHPEFQTEWWYYTGNVTDTKTGRPFGYQFTIFRRALAPGIAGNNATPASSFASNQIYFAHFAVTDVAADAHREAERFSRGAAGLAGASQWDAARGVWDTGQPWRVWLEDWSAEARDPAVSGMRLRAKSGDMAIDLDLGTGKSPVLQGDRGLSQKGAGQGNASYYYSLTRMPTAGRITTPAGTFDVAGLSWMDREWSTSALDKGTQGWDWFALQLGDGRELMYYQLRTGDGGVLPLSKGTIIEADGTYRSFGPGEISITPQEPWTTADGRRTYPTRWRINLPSANLALDVAARVKDQEMNVSTVYWEGAVGISGTSNGAPVGGSGYIEMTGYGESALSDRL